VRRRFLIAKFNSGIRSDAIRRSQSTVGGKVAEQFVPFLPGFEFHPRDARFLGMPIDYVVFDGLSNDAVERVVFIEVKTGGKTLSKGQRQIREAIQAGVWNGGRSGRRAARLIGARWAVRIVRLLRERVTAPVQLERQLASSVICQPWAAFLASANE
jgi:hypothetical protein